MFFSGNKANSMDCDSNSEDFCMNCKIFVIPSEKIWKILRFPYRDDISPLSSEATEDAKPKEIAVTSAMSTVLNESGIQDIAHNDRQFVCLKCGKLLELAYNAVLDFRDLSRKEKLPPKKNMSSLKPKTEPTDRQILPEKIGKRLNLGNRKENVKTKKLCTIKRIESLAESVQLDTPQILIDEDLSTDKLKCKLCDKGGYISAEDLKRHFTAEHVMVSLLTPNEVQSETDSHGDKLVPNGRFIFICNVCNKRFSRHDHITLHLRVHTKEKPFSCRVEGCKKTFSDPRGLAYHEVTHSSVRPYCCKFCGMTFKRLHHLNDHERNHNEVPRRFACQHCDKAFKQQKHLNSHLITHQGTKEHQCALCNKLFNRKDNLQQHIKKVHSKETPTNQAKSNKKEIVKASVEQSPSNFVLPPSVVNAATASSEASVPSIVIPERRKSRPTASGGAPTNETNYINL